MNSVEETAFNRFIDLMAELMLKYVDEVQAKAGVDKE